MGVASKCGMNIFIMLKFMALILILIVKIFAKDNIDIQIGSQNDKTFLRRYADDVKSLDIIIDDGGHTMEQQLNTFKILFPILNDGGIYIVEDVESSYQNMYGGGPKRNGTFIEFSKFN